MSINVEYYNSNKKNEWDSFIKSAKNGHFMFCRDYMEYHADRFVDQSFMFYDEKARLIAVLPANLSGGKLYSHQGLTFGGLVVGNKTNTASVISIFKSALNFLKEQKTVDGIVYKRMPDFYASYPTQEDLYALFLLGASLIGRSVSACINLDNPIPFQEMRRRNVKKAKKNGLIVSEEFELADVWSLLTGVLAARHAVKPTHSLNEIEILRNRFRSNIRCFSARKNDELLAGVVVYETANVAHTQYLASGEIGRECGALDIIVYELITNVFKDKKYFDFGISTENNGAYLNEGLMAQKEGFGARAFVHDTYEIKLY